MATSELVDPTPYLEGEELLLTTGLAMSGWRGEWTAYVTRLRDAGVAGLGLGTGLTHRVPPRGLIRACEELGVNLIEVPRLTAFVAISRRAADLLEKEESQAARTALELQRQLTAAAAGSDPATAILRQLSKSLNGVGCLLAPNGQVLAGSPGAVELEEIRNRIKTMRPQGRHAALTLSEPGFVTVVQPIGLHQRPESYLVTGTPGRPTEPQRRAVGTAGALLSLVSQQQRDQTDTRRRVAARAFALLLTDDQRTAELLLDIALPHNPTILAAHAPTASAEQSVDDAVVDGLVVAEAACPLAVLVEGELFVVSTAEGAERIAAELARLGLLVGIGNPAGPQGHGRSPQTAGPDGLGASRETAVLALAQATAASPVVRWSQLVREGLSALVDDHLAAAFAASYLESLTEEQLEVLRTFLRHHGSRLKVAEELGLHRNTVRNRVRQIEAQLGDSLDNPQVRMTAWFALQYSVAGGPGRW
ncbi:PucR family transcriptional regulator [Streptomyces sp. SID13031]|nr:PucR family transcriptional regulator [Streptomyces sp. SID13031]